MFSSPTIQILEIMIGFNETFITVDEYIGVVEVCAAVLDGDLKRITNITLSFNPIGATGRHFEPLMCHSSYCHLAILPTSSSW